MIGETDPTPAQQYDSAGAPMHAAVVAAETVTPDAPAPVEIGGRNGPDPTRYGDWEKNGRCIDF